MNDAVVEHAAGPSPASVKVNPAGVERLVADASSPQLQVRRHSALDIGVGLWLACPALGPMLRNPGGEQPQTDRPARTCRALAPAQAAPSRF